MLGTPPAFVLSQDQTLKKLYLNYLSVAQIIFQVICSSKFYSRIFVGLNSIFYSKLKQFIIVQGVLSSSSRYSIYKVQCEVLRKLSLAANFYILAYRFLFVKNFFQVFSNFFSIRFISCRSRDSFDIISLHNRFVNTFFKGNYFYFEILFRGAGLGRFPPVPAVS